MALPLSYNVRNVRQRWQVTLLAIVGIALVVTVFVVLTAMSTGFRIALRATGRTDNAIIVQRGSNSELTSGINRGTGQRHRWSTRAWRAAPTASPWPPPRSSWSPT